MTPEDKATLERNLIEAMVGVSFKSLLEDNDEIYELYDKEKMTSEDFYNTLKELKERMMKAEIVTTNIAIVEKDITQFKLTVAKDRLEIKVPISSEASEREIVIPFLTNVANTLKETEREFTLRGTFNKAKGLIIMESGIENKFSKTFCI